MRNTKVQGWSVKVSEESRVERDSSPGADHMEVMRIDAEIPIAGTVSSKAHTRRLLHLDSIRESIGQDVLVQSTYASRR